MILNLEERKEQTNVCPHVTWSLSNSHQHGEGKWSHFRQAEGSGGKDAKLGAGTRGFYSQLTALT